MSRTVVVVRGGRVGCGGMRVTVAGMRVAVVGVRVVARRDAGDDRVA